MNPTRLATFAKYMVCPFELTEPSYSKTKLGELGLESFLEYPYRQLSSRYKGDSVATTGKLLAEIKTAVQGGLKNKKVLLLLSDGKDSMALALALAELGVSAETLSFLRDQDDELRAYISKLSMELGHRPHFKTVSEIVSCVSAESFFYSFKGMENPILDQGYLFFWSGIQKFFRDFGASPEDYQIIDGLGNDETFGYLPSNDQYRAFQVSKCGLWRLRLFMSLPFQWYLRSPAEAHGMRSALSMFFPIRPALDLNAYFEQIPYKESFTVLVDHRAFCRGKHHDHICMMGKTRETSRHLGADFFFPWLEKNLSNYCFNLPADEKYDRRFRQNKVLLRKLLQERFSWAREKRGVDLFKDVDADRIRTIMKDFVPASLFDQVQSSPWLPKVVRTRATLELSNFYCFGLTHNYDHQQLREILLGY